MRGAAVGNAFMLIDNNGKIKVWENGKQLTDITTIEGLLHQNKSWLSGNFVTYPSEGHSFIYAGNSLYELFFENGKVTSKILLEGLDIPVFGSVYYHKELRKFFIGSHVSGLYVVTLSDFSFPQQAPDAIDEGFFCQALLPDGRILCQRYIYGKDQPPVKVPLRKPVGATYYLSNYGNLYYSDEPVLYRFNLHSQTNHTLMPLDSRPASLYADPSDSTVIILATSQTIAKIRNDQFIAKQELPAGTNVMGTVQIGKDTFILATRRGLKWYDFTHNKIFRTTLDTLYIRSIYPESPEKVWISTYGKGFYLYEKGIVYTLPVHTYEGLRTIHSFIEDGRGNFWLPTNNGLFLVKKSSLEDYAHRKISDVYYYKYSVLDNLPTNEFNGGCIPAYIWTPDSMLSIPSLKGLVQFYPQRTKPSLPGNKIFTEQLMLDDTLAMLPSNGLLQLPPDYKSMSIRFSSPYFGAAANLQLLYKLEGLNNSWRSLPPSGRLVLDGLQSGNYTLKVRKGGMNEATADDVLSLAITVRPWFYNTWWFRLLAIAIVSLLITVLVRLRFNILKERNRKLQEIIQEKTEDLNRTILQLKHSEEALLASNRTKDKVITMVLHDLRSPIRFLHTIIAQLNKRKQELPEDLQEQLQVLHHSTRSLNDFTEQFFAWAVSQRQGFQVNQETFPLQNLFLELQDLYVDMAFTNHNKLLVNCTDLQVCTDKNILSAVLRNLIDNANKNTREGIIELTAQQQDGLLCISIIDTGKGMDNEAIASFFNKQAALSANGHGSLIVLNLLEKIGGKLSIAPKPDGGTIFRIALPNFVQGHVTKPAEPVR